MRNSKDLKTVYNKPILHKLYLKRMKFGIELTIQGYNLQQLGK